MKTTKFSETGRGGGGILLLSRVKGPLLIFLAALYFFILAGQSDQMPMPGQLGAFFWPKAILILLMVSCGIKSFEILRGPSQVPEERNDEPIPEVSFGKLAVLIALVIGAVATMNQIGFLLSNFLFLLLFLRATGVRKKAPLLLISAGGTALLLYLFVKVVYLPLPKGRWFFDDLTISIYRLMGLF